MAPTRPTARLLDHAAQAGAKVIAIGDSGQLPSVLAGGWLRAVGERIGALELTEVMRQRDAEERRALGALHDGLPGLYIEWATSKDRIEVVSSDQIVEQAVGEWIGAAADQAPGQVVMISRDNEKRSRLNELARARRSEAGELGDERSYRGTPIAVGERVICRNNDARIGVDNGTRGTVRHVDDARIVLETDSGVVRELPASYVVDHVEHAYCLTGHGMQGGTVERAIVVASPEDLTAGWSYSALSRARGETRLLIADSDRREAARTEHAPEGEQPDRSRPAIIARATQRMRVRDDEDLAIDQLQPAGREDDRSLAFHRAAAGTLPQELGAARGEAVDPAPSLNRLIELREEMARLRIILESLPTKPLARFDELDAKERDLFSQRTQHEEQLAALETPARRLGRIRDPHAEERAFLQTAIEMDDRAISDIRADRARLQRELGDPDQIRSERDGLKDAIADLQRGYEEVRDVLVEASIERVPGWLIGALGERPEGAREREIWDRAGQAVAGYRLDHDVVDTHSPLGPAPPGGIPERLAWDDATAALERSQRQLGRQPAVRDQGIDLGVG
jgi:hypothetical protein